MVLDPATRAATRAEINLYWKLNAQAAATGLTGPRLTHPRGSAEWTIHEWSWSQ